MSTHRRSHETNLEMSDRRIYRVASITTIVIAICAAVLSYSALRELAIHSGIEGTLAYLFPLTLDGLILIGALMVLFAATRGRRSWGGVFLTSLGVISSVAGNVAVSPNTLTARLVHAAAPIVLFLAVEAVTSLMRKMRNETQEHEMAQVAQAQPATAPASSNAAAFFENPTSVREHALVASESVPTVSVASSEPAVPLVMESVPVPAPAVVVTSPEPASILVAEPEQELEVADSGQGAPVFAEAASPVSDAPAPDPANSVSLSEVPEAEIQPEITQPQVSTPVASPSVQDPKPAFDASREREVATLNLRPDMTARQRVVAYIEAGYHDVTNIADEIGGDRKYIRKLAREELDRRGLVSA